MLALFARIWQRFLPSRLVSRTDEVHAARLLFDPEWYITHYPDVAAAGMDPWKHYWQHGRFEGRLPQRNRAIAWEHALWRGAEAVIVPRLERLLIDELASVDEQVSARVALARWYRWQEAWERVVELLEPDAHTMPATRDLEQNPHHQREYWHTLLLLVEAYCRLAQGGAQYSVPLAKGMEALEQRYPAQADSVLAHANLLLVEEPHNTLKRLEPLNRFFTAHGLCQVAPIHPSRPLTLDNLRALPAPEAKKSQLQDLPLVSVIVPMFNAGEAIGTALSSLLAQRGVRLEILVVDDASQDDAADNVLRLAASCPPHVHLRLLRHEVNQGAYAARNTGAAHASGQYITVHDSDDWSHPDKLRLQVAAMEGRPQVMASISYWVRATPSLLFHRWRLDEYGWVYPNISSLMVRRDAFTALGWWDDVKVNADTEYRERLIAAYGAASVQGVMPGIPLAFGRASAASLSQGGESHLVSQFTGGRYHYMAAARCWHEAAGTPGALYLPRHPERRLFYAPSAMLREDKRNPQPLAFKDHLRASDIFDPGGYLTRYIDLQLAMVDPFEHFCQAGSMEGRDPGPNFSTSGYRRNHQQALEGCGLAPWQHYLLHHAQADAHLEEALPVWDGQRSEQGRFTVLLCAHQAGATLFGAERSLLDVLDAMTALGWRVVVLLPEANNAVYEEALRQKSHAVAVVPYGWWQQGKRPVAKTVEHIQRLIERFNIKAVHANTLVLDEPLEAARREGIPAVVHVRELPAHDAALCETLGATPAQLVERTHASADLVIANSQTVASAFSTMQDAQSPIGIVPNTIHMQSLLTLPSNFSADKASFCVGMLSSNLPKKGLDDIEKVAEALATLAPQVQLRLYGPQSSALDRLLARQADKVSSGRLVYAGYVESPAQALAEVDAVVNLSHFQESFGRTVLEAMAAGRPVVAYAWGALPELVVEGATGYLVPFAQPLKVAERIAQLSQSPELCRTLGLAGRQRAANEFGAEKLKVALEQSYKMLNAAFNCHFKVTKE